jgi:hypothetical protein
MLKGHYVDVDSVTSVTVTAGTFRLKPPFTRCKLAPISAWSYLFNLLLRLLSCF